MFPDIFRVDGRVALVTGGSKGLGKAMARGLAEAGADIVISSRHEDELRPALEEILSGTGRRGHYLVADMSRRDDVLGLARGALEHVGKIDILVNNAGVYDFKPLEEITEEEFHREFNTNVLGMMLATQEGLKHFGPEGGSVINIGSLASSLTPPTGVVYNATKGAVDAITRTLAKELGPRKIRVNSINPGMVVTEGAVAGGYTEGDMRKMFESQTPLGRVGQTDDIAPAAVFFASDDSKWITGETLRIAGGLR